MTSRRRPQQPWETGGGIPGSLSGPPLPPEAFRGGGGRRIRQRRHGRPPRLRNWRAPAWLVPAVFLCILLALIVVIIVAA
jgi:hypothetical protein